MGSNTRLFGKFYRLVDEAAWSASILWSMVILRCGSLVSVISKISDHCSMFPLC